MIKFSPGRSQNYLHIWINIISTFPCYTDVSILKAYWNLQNLQKKVFKYTTSTTNTNMNILIKFQARIYDRIIKN